MDIITKREALYNLIPAPICFPFFFHIPVRKFSDTSHLFYSFYIQKSNFSCSIGPIEADRLFYIDTLFHYQPVSERPDTGFLPFQGALRIPRLSSAPVLPLSDQRSGIEPPFFKIHAVTGLVDAGVLFIIIIRPGLIAFHNSIRQIILHCLTEPAAQFHNPLRPVRKPLSLIHI